MKVLIILAVTICLWAVSASGSPIEWAKFKAEYNKIYKSVQDEAEAFSAFSETLESLKSHNNSFRSSFEVGINSLADMSFEKYKRRNTLRALNYNLSSSIRIEASSYLIDDSQPVPESLDWREKKNRVGPVKDQGQCGSCWSFATTGLLEGQEYLNSTASMLVPLSEQQFVDCDQQDLGCQGGDLVNALNYARAERGVETEKDYPYHSGDGYTSVCEYKEYKAFVTTTSIGEPVTLPPGDEEALKRAVARFGPVAVGMDASHRSFQMYRSGVYLEPRCSSENLDHAVLVVGYGTCKVHGDYWIVKNSWGTKWGSNGYFKIARNRDNHCGLATSAVIVQ